MKIIPSYPPLIKWGWGIIEIKMQNDISKVKMTLRRGINAETDL